MIDAICYNRLRMIKADFIFYLFARSDKELYIDVQILIIFGEA
jgi:hypothetical protein